VCWPCSGVRVSIASCTTETRRPRSSKPLAANRTQYSVTTPKTTNSASRSRRSTSGPACRLSKMSRVCFSRRTCWLEKCRLAISRSARWDGNDFVGQCLHNKSGASCPLDAVGWKCLELGVVICVITAMRNQEHSSLAGRLRELPNIGQQPFRAGHIQPAPGSMKSACVSTSQKNNLAAHHFLPPLNQEEFELITLFMGQPQGKSLLIALN
jgi:hypothetical protein